MENRAHALIAGIFLLLLGAAAAFSVWWFTDQREDVTTYQLVSTGSVTGLNPQAQVRFRGISAGKVDSITIDPDDLRYIIVTITIRSDIPVTQGTRASLGYQGVTGLAFVQLDDRGTDPRPLMAQDGHPPRLALESGLLEQLSDVALGAAKRLRQVSDSVGQFFDQENVNRFHSLMVRLESASEGLDKTLSIAPEAIADLRRMLSEENAAHLASLLSRLDDLSGEMGPLADDARTVMTRMDTVLANLDAIAKTTGDRLIDTTLPKINDLLAELTDTAARAGRLIDEVEASPQMLLTGRSERAPGPGEEGFEP